MFEGAASAQERTWVEVSLRGEIPAARLGHSLTNVDGKIYMFGGVGAGPRVANATGRVDSVRGLFNDIWQFNEGAVQFDEITPMNAAPPARDHHTAVAALGKLWIFFGIGQAGFRGDVWLFDPKTESFTQMPTSGQMPQARAFHSTVVIDDKIYVFGGLGGSRGDVIFDDMWEYNPMTNTWRFVADLPEGFYGAATTAIGKKLVVFGGYDRMGIRRKLLTFCTDVPDARVIENAISDGDPPPTGFANLISYQPSSSDATDLFTVAGEVIQGQVFKPNPMTFMDRAFMLADDCKVERPELAEEHYFVPEPVTSAPATIVSRFAGNVNLDGADRGGSRSTVIFVFGGRTATGNPTDRAFALLLEEEPPVPDLTGAWEGLVLRCNAAAKCKLKGSFAVRNLGVEAAPASTLAYYLSEDGTLDEGDLLLKRQEVPAVPAGDEVLVPVKKVKLPSGTSGAGKFVIAVLDDDDAVAEGDEANNAVVFGPL